MSKLYQVFNKLKITKKKIKVWNFKHMWKYFLKQGRIGESKQSFYRESEEFRFI